MAFGKKKEEKVKKGHSIASDIGAQQKIKQKNLRLILASAVLAGLVFVALNVIQSNILNREEKIKVYVANTAITEGTKITDDNFKSYVTLQERTIKNLPENYITEDKKDTLINNFVTREFIKNDVITSNFIIDTESYIKDIKNPIEVSLKVSSLSDAVGGILREGDIINIYAMSTNKEKKMESNPIMLGAYITKAFDSNGAEISTEDNETPTAMFNLIISEDAEVEFNKSIYSGTLRISKKLSK